MSFSNPTPIEVGMAGTLNGRPYRVAGRVTMGMDDAGETYYWNEFNLVSDQGESATLVYEETERGGEWRLFTMFEPEYPITAADAATKRVGDPLNLDGLDVRVTLVDESRVYAIEGEAPEGVEVGDVARYFNAETADRMMVVSWTGEEVECYRGLTVSPGMVAAAFELPVEKFSRLAQPAGHGWLSAGSSPEGVASSSALFLKGVGAFLLVAIFFASPSSCRLARPRAEVVKTSAPAAPLAVGSAGTLEGRNYRIRGHALVEIAEVGRLYDRHEYHLADEDGNPALLVCGLKPGAGDWGLFTPLEPMEPLTPLQAAALRAGQMVNVNGYIAPITELFQSTIRQAESANPPDLKNGSIRYGFNAQTNSTRLLVRWDGSGIDFQRGIILPAKDVTAAFNRKPGN